MIIFIFTLETSLKKDLIVFIIIFGGNGFDAEYIAAHLCGGGLMLGAFFMWN